jgi:hypothetical protein
MHRQGEKNNKDEVTAKIHDHSEEERGKTHDWDTHKSVVNEHVTMHRSQHPHIWEINNTGLCHTITSANDRFWCAIIQEINMVAERLTPAAQWTKMRLVG